MAQEQQVKRFSNRKDEYGNATWPKNGDGVEMMFNPDVNSLTIKTEREYTIPAEAKTSKRAMVDFINSKLKHLTEGEKFTSWEVEKKLTTADKMAAMFAALPASEKEAILAAILGKAA